ncbi:MAG: hypothetical protein JNL98_32260 [Bryobacterales bacterium]|nr:hypothetical protein [Bryobacterales bacterium]
MGIFTTGRLFVLLGVASMVVSLVLRHQGNSLAATIATSLAFALVVGGMSMRFVAHPAQWAGPWLVAVGILFVYRSAYLFGYCAATGSSDLAGIVSVAIGIGCLLAATHVFHRVLPEES